MFLYSVLKYPVQLGLIFFYKRIYMLGLENIPHDAPVIGAPNHANTLIDPISIACFQQKDMYFWARADVFKNPLVAWFIKQVHLLPIYRPRDGKENMHKNDSTFEASIDILNQNNMLFIAPEGGSQLEKRLRPMKLGPAKLLFQCLEANPEKEFYIQPIGLNFTSLTSGWGDLMMVFGKPIPASDYWEMYKENPEQTKEILMADVKKGLLDVMLHIDTEENEYCVEGLWEMYRNDYVLDKFPKFSYDDKRFYQEQAIARQSQIDPYDDTWEKIAAYFNSIAANGLSDFAIANFKRNNVLRYLFVLVLLPIKVLAFVLTEPLLKYIQKKAPKMVKDIDFKPSVVLMLGIFTYPVLGLLVFLIVGFAYSWSMALLSPFALLIIQYISQYWNEEWHNIKALGKWNSFRKGKAQEAEKLIEQRAELKRYYEQWI